MKLVYTLQDVATVNYLKDVLEQRGIECLIKNEFLRGALGEVPPIECWPELWVMDDALEAEARTLITKTLYFKPVRKSWTCPDCGEVIGGQFTDCWQCAVPPDDQQDDVVRPDPPADKRRSR